jgi:hypothetical protein
MYIYKEVEVDVSLDDYDTVDLIAELESRGTNLGFDESVDGKELLTAIWEKRRCGQDYQRELDELIYIGLGKIV